MITQLELATWEEFKNTVENRCSQIQYVESFAFYDLYGFSRHTSETWHIKLGKASAEAIEFEETFKSASNSVASIVTCLTDINGEDIAGTVEETPNALTILGRLKSIYDKLSDSIVTTVEKVKIWDGTNQAIITENGRVNVTHPPFVKFSESFSTNSVDDINIWSWTKSGSATATFANCILSLNTTTANGDYIYYETLSLNAANINDVETLISTAKLNFGNSSHANNIREFGMISTSQTDGYFIRLTGSQFSVIVKKGGIETSTNISLALDDNWHTFQIKLRGQSEVWFVIDDVVVSHQTETSAVLVNYPKFEVYIRNINTGIIAAGLTLQIDNICISDEGVAGTIARLVAKDNINLTREVLADSAGRLITVFPSIQGATNVINYPATSIGPYVANLWRIVAQYNIPAGFIMNLLNFSASSATANYTTRVVRETYLGRYVINTNVFTDGNGYSNLIPNFCSTVEAEVTTVIGGAVTLTITYVNQSGTGGRTATCALSNADVVGTKRLFTLQAGDLGVKDITACSRSTNVTGAINIQGIDELGFIYNNTANVRLEKSFLPTGIYILGGVGGTINIEITATATGAVVRQANLLYSMFLKTIY